LNVVYVMSSMWYSGRPDAFTQSSAENGEIGLGFGD